MKQSRSPYEEERQFQAEQAANQIISSLNHGQYPVTSTSPGFSSGAGISSGDRTRPSSIPDMMVRSGATSVPDNRSTPTTENYLYIPNIG